MYPAEPGPGTGYAEAQQDGAGLWENRTRIFLQPIAAPSILGLFGFFAATIMVGSNLAGWWGSTLSNLTIFPFAFVIGGVAQFAAALWSYRARDGAATAVHGAWGSFWMAYGFLWLLIALHVLPLPVSSHNPTMAWWFIGLAAITGSVALASLAESLGTFVVTSTLTAGSVLAVIGYYIYGGHNVLVAAGWLFVVSAAAAWYTATAMMMANAFGRTILPLGKWSTKANVPMRKPLTPIEFAEGEPGVRQGQ